MRVRVCVRVLAPTRVSYSEAWRLAVEISVLHFLPTLDVDEYVEVYTRTYIRVHTYIRHAVA
jgi:hypothetical protein